MTGAIPMRSRTITCPNALVTRGGSKGGNISLPVRLNLTFAGKAMRDNNYRPPKTGPNTYIQVHSTGLHCPVMSRCGYKREDGRTQISLQTGFTSFSTSFKYVLLSCSVYNRFHRRHARSRGPSSCSRRPPSARKGQSILCRLEFQLTLVLSARISPRGLRTPLLRWCKI